MKRKGGQTCGRTAGRQSNSTKSAVRCAGKHPPSCRPDQSLRAEGRRTGNGHSTAVYEERDGEGSGEEGKGKRGRAGGGGEGEERQPVVKGLRADNGVADEVQDGEVRHRSHDVEQGRGVLDGNAVIAQIEHTGRSRGGWSRQGRDARGGEGRGRRRRGRGGGKVGKKGAEEENMKRSHEIEIRHGTSGARNKKVTVSKRSSSE